MANAGTVYGINPYLLCLTNPVNMIYNGYTIETDGELSYEPDELSEWKYFWKVTWNKFWNSWLGKGLAIGLFVAATVLAIVCPVFAPIYGQILMGIGLSLGVGGLVAGLRSHNQGNSFWDGFINYINENWSQEVIVTIIIVMVSLGIQFAVAGIKAKIAAKASAKAVKYFDEAGNPIWPPNDGFKGKPRLKTLKPGTEIDRYGSSDGKFASPRGLSFEKRSLPAFRRTDSYHIMRVEKPVQVLSGKIASWFGMPGGGRQYLFFQNIKELIDLGVISVIS